MIGLTLLSRAVTVSKLIGAGFLAVQTARGEVKAFHGDHIIEIPYTRAPRTGEGTEPITKVFKIVVPEDLASALGVFIPGDTNDELTGFIKDALAARHVEASDGGSDKLPATGGEVTNTTASTEAKS